MALSGRSGMVTATGRNANENNVYTASYWHRDSAWPSSSTADVEAYVHYRIQLALSQSDALADENVVVFLPTATPYVPAPRPPCCSHRWNRGALLPVRLSNDVSNNAIDFGFADGI